MLEPFIASMVTSYNFNISSCNCSVSVLLLTDRILHLMQQVYIREILRSCQFPPKTIIKFYTASQNKFSRVVSSFGYTEENLEFLDTPVHTHVHVVTMHEYNTIMTVHIASVWQITVLPMQALYEMSLTWVGLVNF